MRATFLFYSGIIGLAGVAMIVIGIFLIFTDVLKKSPWSIVLVCSVLAWIIGESMGLLDTESLHLYYWNTIKYMGISFIGPAWFGVATQFSGKSWWIGPKGTATLIASSGLFSLAVITEPLHHLLSVPTPAEGGGKLFQAGILWYLLIFSVFFYLIGGLLVLKKEVARFPRIAKRRGIVLIIVVIIPTLFGLVDIAPLPLPTNFPLVPLAITISSLVLFYGFIRLRLAAPLKLARETIIDMLTDPVIVIDEAMHIASANPAARNLSTKAMPAIPGVRLDDAFPGLEAIALEEGRTVEYNWSFGGKDYIVRPTFVEDPKSSSRAVIVTLSDITHLVDEQERLEKIVEERTALLKRANEELEEIISSHEESERRLQAALVEKELLLKEIHHRIKNNLQIVTSLISLQSNRIASDEARSAYAALTSRIKSISLVHERIYQAASFTKVELGQYVRDLVSLIASSVADHNFPVTVDVPESGLEVDPDSCIDIGLILNEVVINAVKHGHSAEKIGSLNVRVIRDVDMVEFRVHDTGPGFSSENPERSGSLGMKVIQSIAAKYHATVSFRNDDGATVIITFPASKILA